MCEFNVRAAHIDEIRWTLEQSKTKGCTLTAIMEARRAKTGQEEHFKRPQSLRKRSAGQRVLLLIHRYVQTTVFGSSLNVVFARLIKFSVSNKGFAQNELKSLGHVPPVSGDIIRDPSE